MQALDRACVKQIDELLAQVLMGLLRIAAECVLELAQVLAFEKRHRLPDVQGAVVICPSRQKPNPQQQSKKFHKWPNWFYQQILPLAVLFQWLLPVYT
jgi:Mg2+/citrate symporter